jgi:HK97 gp10 family phage protein
MAKFRSDLSRIARNAPKNAKTAARATAADIIDITRQIVPVDTGALRDSYTLDDQTRGDKVSILIGTDLDYGPYVEEGTARSPAQPHLGPAFDEAEETFTQRLIDEVINNA